MVYNTQNYWGFGLCPSSGILETSINFYLLVYPTSMYVRALSQFLLNNFLLSPAELAWSHVIK
jgi:hypothetical protein